MCSRLTQRTGSLIQRGSKGHSQDAVMRADRQAAGREGSAPTSIISTLRPTRSTNPAPSYSTLRRGQSPLRQLVPAALTSLVTYL